MSELRFTAYGKPHPQGSARGFIYRSTDGKQKVAVTGDNGKVMPYRHTLTQVALEELRKNTPEGPLCARPGAVEIHIVWTLAKPKSKPKRVIHPTCKPDADKLTRAVLDALTGVAYEDDSQVVQINARKEYGSPEKTEVIVLALLQKEG